MLCHSTPQHALSLSLCMHIYIHTHTPHTCSMVRALALGSAALHAALPLTRYSGSMQALLRLYQGSIKVLLGLDQGSIKALLRID